MHFESTLTVVALACTLMGVALGSPIADANPFLEVGKFQLQA